MVNDVMAISLAHLSKDSTRQRASTVPSSMRPYNPSEIVPMPVPEHYNHYYPGHSSKQDYGAYRFFQSYPPASQQSQEDSSYHISLPSAFPSPSPYHCSSSEPWSFQSSPRIPPKEPLDESSSASSSPTSARFSEHSNSTSSESSFSRSSIEPDPLPPHSNPQALSQTQSEAFSGSKPKPALRVGRDEVYNSHTGFPDYRIAREEGKIMPSFMSTKPRISVIKTENGASMGNIRFHTLSSNKIDLTVNGRETSISHTGLVHNRWGFQSTTIPNVSETWYWKKDRETGGAMLEDAKRHGSVLAKMKGDLLTFEKARLREESYEEIVMSAIAMAEAARRQKRKSDIVDIAAAMGDFMASDGKHSNDSNVGSN